jgi:hypothetical protein
MSVRSPVEISPADQSRSFYHAGWWLSIHDMEVERFRVSGSVLPLAGGAPSLIERETAPFWRSFL